MPSVRESGGIIKYSKKYSSFSSVYFAIAYSDAEICIIFDMLRVIRSKKLVTLVDEEKAVYVVRLDFSKSFDTVSYSILPETLAAHGLDKCTLFWVKKWLNARAQRVLVKVLHPVGG
ncbi:hypothetical protein WISP_113936 [Willisornis vidua]|uniref:Reverse transcriptase domain-containing protein n=1 Tax=Willisornis vidua TaxID=1566151 RepID=A0ABQ9CZA8_9PASS|nr:hypothetical protein WISP_113936 [Willisornis vidua]